MIIYNHLDIKIGKKVFINDMQNMYLKSRYKPQDMHNWN